MAGLGMGAGAFEGDTTRNEENLKAIQLRQQAVQARTQADLQQQQIGLEQQRIDSNSEKTAFDQQQTLRQNDWLDTLNEKNLREADLQYQGLVKLRDEEETQRINRDQVAKSAVGQMIRLAYEDGGVRGKNFVSASQLDSFRKSDPRFQGLQAVTWGDDGQGGRVLQMTMQEPDGQPMSEVIDQGKQFLVLSHVYGEKTANGIMGRVDKAVENRYMSERGQSLLGKQSNKMEEVDKVEYGSLSKLLAAQTSAFDTEGAANTFASMKAITSKYRQSQQPEPVQPAQEKSNATRESLPGGQQSAPEINYRAKIQTMGASIFAKDRNLGLQVQDYANKQIAAKVPGKDIYDGIMSAYGDKISKAARPTQSAAKQPVATEKPATPAKETTQTPEQKLRSLGYWHTDDDPDTKNGKLRKGWYKGGTFNMQFAGDTPESVLASASPSTSQKNFLGL